MKIDIATEMKRKRPKLSYHFAKILCITSYSFGGAAFGIMMATQNNDPYAHLTAFTCMLSILTICLVNHSLRRLVEMRHGMVCLRDTIRGELHGVPFVYHDDEPLQSVELYKIETYDKYGYNFNYMSFKDPLKLFEPYKNKDKLCVEYFHEHSRASRPIAIKVIRDTPLAKMADRFK